ncbi:DUF4091 domain-containing protein [Fulvivirgaceae bacterium BMA10]|uniref:DUF4091 domain-containing protein n=1 Tax=Splendidivirga corallicola TaxID=3051826 RepID=A0ABT8KJX0_9BACT|nr:DUF4091 domain-containing protein [Fulvivirgaceae bacterium BMA10]
MRSITLLLTFLFIQNLSAQVWLVDPLEAIYPDSNWVASYGKKWEADFPKGTMADVHVLIKVPTGEKITLEASLNGKDLGTEVWSQLIDVPVEQNTGLDSRTEQYQNRRNPYVIRRAPFRIFEVIKSLDQKTLQTTSVYTAFRLSVPSTLINTPGVFNVNITVNTQHFTEQGEFKINVHAAELPGLSESQFFYTNWFGLSRMEEQHELERWSEPWYNMLEKYAQLMAHGRQNCIIVPRELITFEDDQFRMEGEKMLRFIDVFRKYGFQYFESPHLMNRGENDDWGDPELKVALTKRRYYQEQGKDDIEKLVTLIKDFTIENNLTNNWLQHISDEPTAVNAKCYRDVVKQVKTIYPEVKIMEATNDRDSIAGAIDIWCPIINDFQENESFFREREQQGEKVLVYTCLVPGGKWLNRTLDMEKLRQVYFGWGSAFYNTGGYLHWGLNQYFADPFEQSVVKHPSPAAGPNNFLPAGDTHIIYPDESGPLSSVRFEAHRIGCEDYELLQRLKTNNPKLQQKLIRKLFRSYTDYNLNLKDYRKTRRKLLKALG